MEAIIVEGRAPVIVAVSGGIVSNEDNWNYLNKLEDNLAQSGTRTALRKSTGAR